MKSRYFTIVLVLLFAFGITSACKKDNDIKSELGSSSSSDSSDTEYSFSDGDTFLVPDDVTLKSITSGDFSGVSFYTGTNNAVSGFASKTNLQETTSQTSSSAILSSAVNTLDGTTDIASITAISISSNAHLNSGMAAGDASEDVTFGSYSITTASSMSSDQLSRIVIKLIGLNAASGSVAFSIPAEGDATTDFRLEITLSYTSTETPIIIAIVPAGVFSTYEGTINLTVQMGNMQPAGTTRVAGNDSFTVAAQSAADFLFVVDNSGSMSEEQTAVSDNATRFFTKLSNKGLDFKIGVITTDSSALAGTGFTSTQADFESNILVGTSGSYLESGIYHAEEALSAGGSVVLAGYPRTGATLSVIMLSDEEDQYTSYSNGVFNFTDNVFIREGYKVFSIVSVPDSGCYGDGGSAGGSSDYPTLSTNTGGAKGSICQSDYSATLDTIIASGGQTFTLTNTPVVKSLVVKVNGTTIAQKLGDNGYLYLEKTKSITFYGTAIPSAGDSVTVSYEYYQ
jgi:hypothetical protein